MSDSSSHLVVEVGEVRAGIAGVLLFALAAGLRVLSPHTATALLAYVVVVALASSSVGPRLALLLAVTAWALFTGFTVGTDGQLTMTRHGLEQLVLLAGVALAASTLGSSVARQARSLDRVRSGAMDLDLRRVR